LSLFSHVRIIFVFRYLYVSLKLYLGEREGAESCENNAACLGGIISPNTPISHSALRRQTASSLGTKTYFRHYRTGPLYLRSYLFFYSWEEIRATKGQQEIHARAWERKRIKRRFRVNSTPSDVAIKICERERKRNEKRNRKVYRETIAVTQSSSHFCDLVKYKFVSELDSRRSERKLPEFYRYE